MIILLDAGPLGMVTNPKGSPETEACKNRFQDLVYRGREFIIPEIADYEVRRELIRANKWLGFARLETLRELVGYAPITTAAMQKAAEFWASARREGRPTAADASLDADVILAAQAFVLSEQTEDTVVATTNTRHLERFTPTKTWREIR